MKRGSAVILGLLFIAFTMSWHSHQASGQAAGGRVTLFDGKNLDNWHQIGAANWRLEDGIVVADKGSGFLVSKNSYTDFQLRVEFWVDEDANSGIFIRCTNPDKVSTEVTTVNFLVSAAGGPDWTFTPRSKPCPSPCGHEPRSA